MRWFMFGLLPCLVMNLGSPAVAAVISTTSTQTDVYLGGQYLDSNGDPQNLGLHDFRNDQSTVSLSNSIFGAIDSKLSQSSDQLSWSFNMTIEPTEFSYAKTEYRATFTVDVDAYFKLTNNFGPSGAIDFGSQFLFDQTTNGTLVNSNSSNSFTGTGLLRSGHTYSLYAVSYIAGYASIVGADQGGSVTNGIFELTVTTAPPGIPEPIPEPSSLALLGVGSLAMAFAASRRRRLTPDQV